MSAAASPQDVTVAGSAALPPVSTEPAQVMRTGGSSRWIHLLGRYGTLVGFVVLFVYFAIVADVFLTGNNLRNILTASATVGVLAIGLTITLVLGDFDLSIGYTATAAGMLAAGTAQSYGMAGGTLAALGLGLLVGLVNGLIVTRLGVSAFIATLGVGQVIAGWLLAYRGSIQITTDLPEDFRTLGTGKIGPIPWILVVWGLVALVLYVLLDHTVLGRRMSAVGGNQVAARLSGIRVERVRLVAFVISGATAGLAGLMLASNLGVGNPTAALGYLLPAFAACFIGAATLRDGQFHIGGTIVGVLMLGVLSNGLVLTGVSPAWTTASQGIVLVVAVTISTFARRVAAR
ncbi:MAG: ABC transporter permease [Ilumatobacteraceae bacterium]